MVFRSFTDLGLEVGSRGLTFWTRKGGVARPVPNPRVTTDYRLYEDDSDDDEGED